MRYDHRGILLTAFASTMLFTSSQNVFAQWTYRVAADPIVRNINVFANNPSAGTNTLIVSTLTDGMYKITDTGNQQTSTFQRINNGLPIVEVRTHATIAPVPATNPITDIYAGTDGAGLYKTTNGGSLWSPLNGSGATAIGCMNIRSLIVDTSTNPRTLIVGTACRYNSGFYKSTTDGVSWTRLGHGPQAGDLPGELPGDTIVSALLRDTTQNPPVTYYAATNNYGILKSTDAGGTWAAANSGITVPSASFSAFNVQFNGTAPNNLIAYVHGSGVYSSSNGGTSWSQSDSGLPANYAALGGIQKESNAILYIGLDKQGVYKSTNNGASWAPWGNSASNEKAMFARALGIAGSTYYIGSLDGLAKTTDGAANINSVVAIDSGGRINAVTHDRDAPYRAYVTGPTLYRLDYIYGDCTAGCSLLDTGVTGNTIEGVAYQDLTNPAVLYVTTSNRGIFKSTNAGASFSPINTGLPSMIGQSSRLAIDENNSQILYLGLSDAAGVFKSTNGGGSWTISNNGLATADARSINAVTLDPNNSAIVYAATDGGLFKSTDSGATWTLKYSATDSGGTLLPVNAVRVRDGNSLEVYIANNHANADGTLASSSGVLKSTDGGNTWTNILPSQAASQVRVLVNGEIFAGISATAGNPAVLRSTDGGATFTPYSGGLNGSDIRSFGVTADRTAVISLVLENGLYTHNAAGPPPSVAVTTAITEAPGIFSRVFLGYQVTGTSSPSKAVTVTNTSATPATIVGFGTTNGDEFKVQSHTCPLTLAAGASCTVNIVFSPMFSGPNSATLLAVGPVTGISTNLYGVGIASGQSGLIIANDPGMVPAYPTFYNQLGLREITFGTQGTGTSRTISVNLQNVGDATANISFSGVSSPMTLGGTCGATIPASGSCTLTVTYAPVVTGVTNQTLTITHNSPFPIQNPTYAFLLYGVAENPANEGSLIPAFGAAGNPGGGGKAFVSFGPYGVESIDRIVTQSDGKIIVLMTARKAIEDGIAVAGVARLNTDGTLDTTWGNAGYVRLAPPAANAFFNGSAGLHALSSGNVIVAFAAATASASNTDLVIYRLLPNGTVDTTFGTGGVTTVANLGFTRLEFYADDRMLATGNTDPVNFNKVGLVRLNANGSVDATFGSGGRADILVPDVIQLANTQAALRTRFAADGKIFVAYSFGAGSARDVALYRLTTSGAIDTSWGTGGRVNVAMTNLEDNIRNMKILGDGRILLLSRSERSAGSQTYQMALARLNADGSPDTLFGTGGVVTTPIPSGTGTTLAASLQVLADGKFVVSGRRNCGSSCLSGSDGFVTRFNADGSLDSSFGSGGTEAIVITASFDSVGDIAIDTDGTIVAGGQVSQFDTDRGNGLPAPNTTGSNVDNGFVVKLKNTVGPAQVNLTVSVTGAGSVTSAPLGINCGNVCVSAFAPSTVVTLTAVPSGGAVFAGWSDAGCPGTGTCTITLATAASVTATFTGGAANLVSVVSRKVHASSGTFDLLISGPGTVEPRNIGAGHKIVFTFDQPIIQPGSASSTIGTATTAAGANVGEVVVTLTGVPDNSRATITLSNVNGDGVNRPVSLGFMLGDVSGSQAINASDISAVKAHAAAFTTLTQQNFKYDVNLSGGINAQDTTQVKSKSGQVLP